MLNSNQTTPIAGTAISKEEFKNTILSDFRLASESRAASMLGRKEVLTGKAKFGIFGDGKELAQIALAKTMQPGDWRAGYYRDQTLAFATGITTIQQLFAQLYANTNINAEPASGGRMMNCHFATRFLNPDGSWQSQMDRVNCSADISTTGGNMGRLLGLALASKKYRNNPALSYLKNFSNGGNEVAFGTIGNASTSEGIFFECVNAAGVLEVPMVISVWDDGYGISVPNEFQTVKEDISAALSGFQKQAGTNGLEIFKVPGWDYPALCQVYSQAVSLSRSNHTPVLVHVYELTQPQGHSTSGSHERYKSAERLQWEREYDCIAKFRRWIIENNIAGDEELSQIEATAKETAKTAQQAAWAQYLQQLRVQRDVLVEVLQQVNLPSGPVQKAIAALTAAAEPTVKIQLQLVRQLFRHANDSEKQALAPVKLWYQQAMENCNQTYHSRLFTNSADSPLHKQAVAPIFSQQSQMVDGREILNACFAGNFTRDERIYIFGEDVGKIGDVNQGLAGLQERFGEERISDTGIREMTIIGQGIGMAMRGLKPIAEIQYLDYLLFGLNVLSDDLATLSYRTAGGQKAPLIIRTRGHRLEGIWHSGSPIGMVLNSLKGIHLCVPRNMLQASGMYNVLLRSDEPALVIESLNGYRLKEKMPDNPSEFMIPLGQPEILLQGQHVTVVSYGSTLRVVEESAQPLAALGISIEIIDLQTLMPFDLTNTCAQSLQKTNKLVIVDEDVPGGASAFIMQQILEQQKGFFHLDAMPLTITAKEHRPPYGTDGDYVSKPSVDDVIDGIINLMAGVNPAGFTATGL